MTTAPITTTLTPAITFDPQREKSPSSFPAAVTRLVDGLAGAVDDADRKASLLASGRGSVAGAAVARAKADVFLEIVAVAASRLNGAITALLQTQV